MAKFEQATDDVVEIFNVVRDKTSIPNWVDFKILCNNKQKEVCNIVKANEMVELLTEGINFIVIINESIFDQLPDDMQELVIDEKLAGVAVSESDALSIEKEDFNTHTGVLQKYGHEIVISLKESIKSLYEQKKQKEEEAKAAAKASKGTGKRGRKPKKW